jgi:cytochrome b involved in lipid metabolism
MCFYYFKFLHYFLHYYEYSFKYIIGLVAVVAIVGGIVLWSRSSPVSEKLPYGDDALVVPNTSSQTETPNTSSTTPAQIKEVTPVTTTTPTTATPVTPSTSASKTFMLAQVATHASSTDCYSAINGMVYDLTAWINKHPGGSREILRICGKDGSNAFNGQHGGDTRPEQILAGFEVGTLVQ